jgi:2-iminoacetate synthase ThiH
LQLPAICDFSVTNVCNAACDFCEFSRDQMGLVVTFVPKVPI